MDQAAHSNNRLELRNNMFVMATLYANGGSTPVRIRNMSPHGALIEAAVPLATGAAVRLTRGSLSVAGSVMWAEQLKAGLRFAAPIAVGEWLPQGKPGSGQQLVDELVHQARLGALPAQSAAPDSTQSLPALDVPGELIRLHQLLERAGEQLALDSRVAAEHMMALQLIDGAAQALARLGAELAPVAPIKALAAL
jgi:hypothetical protein